MKMKTNADADADAEKIYEVTGIKPNLRTGNFFGVEIETEARSWDTFPNDIRDLIKFQGCVFESLTGWRRVIDGSLREVGNEFIFRAPSPKDQTVKKIKDFFTVFKETEFIKDTPNTSNHVHIDFRNSTIRDVKAFILLWFILEEEILKYCGDEAHSNLYSIPIRYATDLLFGVKELFESYKFHIKTTRYRYSALNICSLSSLGTLEVRAFRDNLKEKELLCFIDFLDEFKSLTETLDIHDIMIIFNESGKQGLKDLFKTPFLKDDVIKETLDDKVLAITLYSILSTHKKRKMK